MQLNEKLKSARKKNNFTQQQVADYIGITRQALSRWENGSASPDVSTLKALCKLYNMTTNEFLNDEDEDASSSISKDNMRSKKESIFEMLCLSVVIILMSQFAFIGILVTISIAIWITKTKRFYLSIYILCAITLIISSYNTYIFIDHLVYDLTIYTVTPLK